MDLFNDIRQILAVILNLEDRTITPESYLLRELGAESIDLLEIAAALQEKFQIKIDEALLFLPGIRGGEAPPASFPFLTPERRREIAAERADSPVLKVKDLVSYMAWQLHDGR